MSDNAATAGPPDDETSRADLRRMVFLIAMGIFITTMGQPMSLGSLKFRLLLKDELGLKVDSVATFGAIAAFAWYLKPLAGILSDSFPLFGTRRRGYLLLSSLLAGLLWLLLAAVPRTYISLLAIVVVINACMVMASTVVGGLLVEQGQRFQATGRLSSLRLLLINLTSIVTGPIAGYLASRKLGLTAGVGAVMLLSLVPATCFILHEPRQAHTNTGNYRAAMRELLLLFRAHSLLSAAGMLLLVSIAPGFGTPLLFYQTDTLHFSDQFIGNLGAISGAVGLLGSVVYALVCRRMKLRQLLVFGIVCNVISTLFYLGYRSREAALFIEGAAGLVSTLAQLPLFDLAARATPRGSEGLGYALMMSVWNIGNAASDVFGSWLNVKYHLTFSHLIWLNAGTTALVLLVVPLLPAVLMEQHDR